MSDLVTFYRARLDEDEAAANAAASVAGPDWHHDHFMTEDDRPTVMLLSPEGSPLADMLSPSDEELAPHIARHDPARVLREVEAGRAILDVIFQYEAKIDGEWGDCHSAQEIAGGKCPATDPDGIPALRILAAAYSDHPDYREEWKP